ncbi:hypothetical protein [Alteromonas lipotrueiana]|uniref:hypothetical protein n=1 Tax=Alteromonas lipotrueiana TaxID=2803815 RepID=UPI001C47714A|nr:hypothetical protein [Alteromonas lipotrueiana]|tara:strand:+ start:859 stop:1059 length:201 start_codon:yes stop_codon:yes gene_type:complete
MNKNHQNCSNTTSNNQLAPALLVQVAGAGTQALGDEGTPFVTVKPRPEFTQALGEDGGNLPDPVFW